MKTCKRCGLPLPAGLRGLYRNKRYCSKACGDLARMARKRRSAGKPIDCITRSCEICLRTFTTRRWNQMYCGAKCKNYALNKRRIDKNRRTNRVNSPPPQTIYERAAAIRSTWDEATRLKRLVDGRLSKCRT